MNYELASFLFAIASFILTIMVIIFQFQIRFDINKSISDRNEFTFKTIFNLFTYIYQESSIYTGMKSEQWKIREEIPIEEININFAEGNLSTINDSLQVLLLIVQTNARYLPIDFLSVAYDLINYFKQYLKIISKTTPNNYSNEPHSKFILTLHQKIIIHYDEQIKKLQEKSKS